MSPGDVMTHDELGEVTIMEEPYMHIGDIQVVNVRVEGELPEGFKINYGSGCGYSNGGYILDVATQDLI